MPYDTNIPATNAEATSAMFRGQFNGLKALIDAIQTVSSATVDGVKHGAAGECGGSFAVGHRQHAASHL